MRFQYIKITIFLLSWLLSASVLMAFEKVGTTSFQFLKVMTDARATGMGDAYTAVSNNSDAVFWNPAALTRVQNLDISASYLDWLLDVTHTSMSAAYTIPSLGTLGFQALMTNVGEIEVTRVEALGFVGDNYHPGLTGETMSPGAYVFGVSYARELTDKFAFGLTAKYIREDLDVKAASTIAFDGGLTFRTGFRSLELAAVIRHFGPEVKYIDQSFPLPQTFTIGISGFLVAPEASFLMNSVHHSLRFAYDLSHPRDYNQQHHLGFEYAIDNTIFLRSGYKINYDEEGVTLGLGVQKSLFRFDYSYSDFGEFFDSVHRFSLGFSLN
ncbi:PorV/PorQ family protein [candidate division KSB1 bacterium]|nr:PorV/PorQ family protein [candidate division KSB1 bacterium]